MGIIDATAKSYLQDNGIFADAFNYILFHGEQRLKPELLQELDPVQTVRLTSASNLQGGRKNSRHNDNARSRDLLKKAIIRSDGTAYYVLHVGLEPQSWIDYAMPVRVGAYDFGEYERQVKQIERSHMRNGDLDLNDHHLFLSRFSKEDRLIPVITVVLYLGPDKWEGPMSIHEMMEGFDPELLKNVSDYKMNLITPEGMDREDLLLFQTSLREVMGYIKYSGDEQELKEYISDNSRLKHLDADAARLITAVTKTELSFQENVQEVNMCKAIDDMKRHSREEGIAEGRTEGMLAAARKMFENGLSFDMVRECTDGSVSDQILRDIESKTLTAY